MNTLRKIISALWALVIMTWVVPCVQCDSGMNFVPSVPTAKAMMVDKMDTSEDCTHAIEKSTHSFKNQKHPKKSLEKGSFVHKPVKNCLKSSHHTINTENRLAIQNSDDSGYGKEKSHLHDYALNTHHFHPVFHRIIGRSPPGLEKKDQSPPSFPGIVVKKE